MINPQKVRALARASQIPFISRKARWLVFLTLLVVGSTLSAATINIYVNKSGGVDGRMLPAASNSNTPVASITRAIALAADTTKDYTIIVFYNTYLESVRLLKRDNIHFVAQSASQKPIIRNTAETRTRIVSFEGCSNVSFDGFEVDGTGNTRINTNGIAIIPDVPSGTLSHDIKILNNRVHDFGEAGIAFGAGDFPANTMGCDNITVSGNEVYATNSYSSSASSGISVLGPRKASLSVTGDEINAGPFTIVIEKNIVHDNTNYSSNLHTDCNGIIIDTGGDRSPKAIMQNNLVYNNSGRGLYILGSNNARIYNNVSYQNLRDPLVKNDTFAAGEIVCIAFNGFTLKNLSIFNNIATGRYGNSVANYVVDTKNTAVGSTVNCSYNLSYLGTSTYKVGTVNTNNISNANPLLQGPLSSPFPASAFKLTAGSPAIRAGNPGVFSSSDYLGTTRTSPPDMGAYKY